MILRAAPLILPLLTSLACTPTVLSAADYDRTCTANVDCVITTFGDQCAACAVDLAAVNASALPDLAADRDAAAAACPPWSARFTAECVVPLPPTRPICEAGACVIPEAGDACTFPDGLCHGEDTP